jgi:hypothetical protein
MFSGTRTYLTKTAALAAVVVGLGSGTYGVASAAMSSGSPSAVVAAAPATSPAAPPGAGAAST